MGNVYRIIYTATAMADLEEKARYIAEELQAPETAEKWYLRLRGEIQRDLTSFPKKYPVYPASPWREKGIRQAVFRNDVVLYSVDDETATVYIRLCCTRGRDLSKTEE